MNRREFISSLAVASVGISTFAQSDKRFKVIGFTKPLQNLDHEPLARAVAEIGWDGIECPVRANGKLTAENAADELPKLIEALRKRGKELTIITTDILSAKQKEAEPLLRLAVKHGIKLYRLGFFKYDLKKSIPDQVKENAAALRDLAKLNKEIGITGAIQNHSGAEYFGAPVWDIWTAIKDLDPKYLGSFFDIAHATKEGGSSWPIEARLMEPHMVTVSVKDFLWEKTAKGSSAEWVPLGNGLVDKSFFKWLRGTKFSGPISHHVEFPIGKDEDMVAKIKQDARTLRDWVGA